MTKIKGIDVSYHQGNINWTKVKADGIKFVILREGFRKTIDEKFLEYVSGCKKAGIPVIGVYHFIYTDGATIAENAKSTVANLKKAGMKPSETWVWVDLEYDTWTRNGKKCTKELCTKYTKEYIAELKELGCKKIGVYMNKDYYRNYYDSSILKNYPIWLADMDGGTPDYKCVIEQYTGSGKVSGIGTNAVDMNYLYDSDMMPKASSTTKVTAKKYVQILSPLNMRKSADLKASIVTVLPKGSKVQWDKKNTIDGRTWYHVIHGTQKGWVSKGTKKTYLKEL